MRKNKKAKAKAAAKPKIKYVVETTYAGLSAKSRISFDRKKDAEHYKEIQLHSTGVNTAEIIEERQ